MPTSPYRFSDPITKPGSNATAIEVTKRDKPWGVIRTFTDTHEESSPWTVIPLRGDHHHFWPKPQETKAQALEDAKQFVLNSDLP